MKTMENRKHTILCGMCGFWGLDEERGNKFGVTLFQRDISASGCGAHGLCVNMMRRI
jgi:hypothetical protein